MQNIEARLSALERSAWRWRSLALMLSVVIVAAIAWGAVEKKNVPDEITCHNLNVVNASGGTVLTVGSNEDGDPSLRFMANGKDAVSFWSSKGIASLTVHNVSSDDGFPGVQLSTSKGKAWEWILKTKTTTAASIGTRDGEGGFVHLSDVDGKKSLSLP